MWDAKLIRGKGVVFVEDMLILGNFGLCVVENISSILKETLFHFVKPPSDALLR